MLAAPVASAAVVEAQPDEVPPARVEVTVAAMGGPQPEAMVAAPEAAMHPTPPMASEAMPILGRTEGVAGEGPSDAVVVAEEAGRELSISLMSGDSRPPVRDEHPLRWGSPHDPSSAIFTLDDGAEGMDRESLGNGITAVLDALNHA